MNVKNKPNQILFLGILAGLTFWLIDGTVDALVFEEDESILESIISPHDHEIYMRSIVMLLFIGTSLFARYLLKQQENINRELSYHKNNLENIVSLRTEQLEILATIDDLTQVYNRRKFFELAQYEVERNARHQHPLTIIMMDIDHFKNINDTHGHQVGDKTLQALSQTIKALVRSTDVFGRIGGEEFALVLPETTKQAAKDFAERIRKCIENEKFPIIERLTISMGVTQLYPDDTSSSLFSRADIALYAAKESGRNRVVTA